MNSSQVVWSSDANASSVRLSLGRVGWLALLFGVGLGLVGCDQSSGAKGGDSLEEPELEIDFTERFQVDPEVKSAYPELTEFIMQGLKAVYKGDYAAYRRLVARNQNPESETRFKLICEALESVRVESVKKIELPDVPPPAYVVTTEFAFDPDSTAATRLRSRSVALLMIKENDAWRLMIAPSKYQPHRELPEEAETAPAETPSKPKVEYPWDVGVDD